MSDTATASDVFLGTGRRKTAVARVRLTRGEGKIIINDKEAEAYCGSEQVYGLAIAPLRTVEMESQINLKIRTHGGGIMGQAGAIAHGIARALEKMDPELRAPLKKAGHLTRDERMKERKKSGQPGARKKFQFSKR